MSEHKESDIESEKQALMDELTELRSKGIPNKGLDQNFEGDEIIKRIEEIERRLKEISPEPK
jgi:hypothetical protein